MRILKTAHLIFSLSFIGFSSFECLAQGGVTVEQDARFEQLLAEKRRINPSITVNDRFKVQIFYGENDKARKTLSDFKKEFKTIDGTIVFESPTYKVWVGSFRSRFEAEKNLADIRKRYPNALLIKANK